MDKKYAKSCESEIEKYRFCQRKNDIDKQQDINKILVSNKVSFGKNGFKYFIGFKDNNKLRPLYILLPKQSI